MPVCAASANAATPNSSGGKRWPPNYAAAPPGAPAPSRPCWRCTTSKPHPSPPEKQHPTGRSPTKPDTQTPAARDHPGRLRGAHQARPPPPAVTMPRPTRDQSGMIEPNPGSPTYFESDHAHDLQVSQCCISVKSPTDQPEQQDGTSSLFVDDFVDGGFELGAGSASSPAGEDVLDPVQLTPGFGEGLVQPAGLAGVQFLGVGEYAPVGQAECLDAAVVGA